MVWPVLVLRFASVTTRRSLVALLAVALVGCPKEGPSDAQLAEANYHAATAQLVAGDAEEAAILLREATQLDPAFTRAHHALGEAYLGLGRGFEGMAEESFRKAISLEEKKYISWVGLAKAQRLQGHTEVAIETFQHAATLEPKAAEPHRTIGDILANLGDVEGAVAAYQEAAKRNARDRSAEALVRLAMILIKQGKHEQAAEVLEDAITRTKAEVADWQERIAQFRKHKREKDADEASVQLEARKADVLELYQHLGDLFVRVGRHAKALEYYRQVLQRGPDDPVTWQVLGTLQLALDDAKAAMSSFERARTLAPGSPSVHEGIARVHLRAGRKKEAEEAIDKAISLFDPEGDEPDEVFIGVAEVLSSLGDHPRSASIYRMLLAEQESNVALWVALAQEHEAAGLTPERDGACERARKVAKETITSGICAGP